MKNEPFVHVHISNLAAQTGVTRFTQIHEHWMYSKNESLQPEQLQEYSHLLVEAKSKYSPTMKSFIQTHVILDSVETFSHVSVNYKLIPPVKIKTRPALFILEKMNFRDYQRGSNVPESIIVVEENVSKEIHTEELTTQDVDSPDGEILIDSSLKETDETDTLDNLIAVKTVNENDTKTLEESTEKHDESNSENEQDIIVEGFNQKQKKAPYDLKSSRQERKKKALAKIKSETRKEVVASAKEKLREIMKRHKHIAEELSEAVIPPNSIEENEVDGRGDIPETETVLKVETTSVGSEQNVEFELQQNENDTSSIEKLTGSEDTPNRANENLDAIVEEVINRLIDRKLYDDRTKPEDIKVEDRQMIQKIVEEVLAEKMNYKSGAEN